jgi:hypothetical protein
MRARDCAGVGHFAVKSSLESDGPSEVPRPTVGPPGATRGEDNRLLSLSRVCGCRRSTLGVQIPDRQIFDGFKVDSTYAEDYIDK